MDALGYATNSSAQAEARTRIKRGLNAWQRRVLVRPGFARLLRDFEETLTTVTGQAVYGFSEPLGRLNGIYDGTNRWPLQQRDLSWLRNQGAYFTTSTGTPTVFIPRGWAPVATQPSAADKVYAVSSGTNTDQLAWDFLLSDGTRLSGVTALTSTVAVQLGSATTIVAILAATYQGTNPNTITLKQTSGSGTTLGVIQPGRSKARYYQVQLWPTPSAALAYVCDFTAELRHMTADQDEPLIPPDFHHVLSLGAQADEFKRRGDDRYGVVRDDLDGELKYLNRWLWDLVTNLRPQRAVRTSRLGAWFPAGT